MTRTTVARRPPDVNPTTPPLGGPPDVNPTTPPLGGPPDVNPTTPPLGGPPDTTPTSPAAERTVFYYDVGSPWCWLTAERLTGELDSVPIWQPVLAAGLGTAPAAERASVERLAAAAGLLPLRWPDAWPFDSEPAMLAATFARGTGRAVAFSLAAMRQAFAAGRDLSVVDNVLIAAAACELHPRAVLSALQSRRVASELIAATADARTAGVAELPALALRERVFSGPAALDELVEALARRGNEPNVT